MVRTSLGIVGGVVAAFGTITIAEYLLVAMLPPISNTVMGSGPIAALPLQFKLLVIAGWLVGAAMAAWIAGRPVLGWIPAGLVVIGGIVNITMIPHPVWMSIAAIVAPIAGGWIGVRLARR